MTRKRATRVDATRRALESAIVPTPAAPLTRRVTTGVVATDRTTHETLTEWLGILNGPGEPQRGMGRCVDAKGRPRSVCTAIYRMPPKEWHRLGLEGYGLTRESDRASLMADCVVWDASETDHVEVIRRGSTVVRWVVWIDPKGRFKVDVWP